MINRIGSVLFWGFIVLTSLLLFPIAVVIWLVTTPFDPRRRALHQFTCFWGSLYTWVNPWWRVTIRGRDQIDPHQTYVMTANHASLVDILVLFRLFTNFTWVSKVENFRVPLIGWNMSMNGYIPLKRGDRDSGREMMQRCTDELLGGTSIMMFPEGRRTRDGNLLPFKPGAFKLAIDTGLPILPIVVTGTRAALPRRGFVLQGRSHIGIEVLPPITPEEFGTDDPVLLADRVREAIAAAISQTEPA